MSRLSTGDPAPHFSLPDHLGQLRALTDVLQSRNALLVFNLGFVWPHCVNHMAQLRHDYGKYEALDTEVLVMVPNGTRSIAKHTDRYAPPYPVLSDKGSLVARLYQIPIRQAPLIKVAIMTISVFLVDQSGIIRYAYYPKSYIEEPANEPPLAVLRKMAKAEPALPGIQ